MISVSDGAGRVARTSRAYTPEQIEALIAAYEGALATLNTADRIDLVKQAIARKLFELAERDSECTPALLYARALTELDLQEVRYYPPVGI